MRQETRDRTETMVRALQKCPFLYYKNIKHKMLEKLKTTVPTSLRHMIGTPIILFQLRSDQHEDPNRTSRSK